MAGVWAKGTSKQNLEPLRTATVEANNFKCGTQTGFGTSLAKKTTFRTKIGGGLGQGSIQTKFGTPYVFLHPLMQKFGAQLGFGSWD